MIPEEFLINDTRDISELSKKSFSGYAVKDVVNILNKRLIDCKLEEAVNWATELLLSGQTEKLWEKIFNISLKNININNPKLPLILYKRYSKFVSLKIKHSGSIKSSNIAGFLSLRNSQAVRNMICEICIIVCNSTKLKAISLPKIKMNHFNLDFLKTKLTASDPNLVRNKLKYGDPDQLKIPLNEFNSCLKAGKWELCIFWLSWIFEWEKQNMPKSKEILCGVRKVEGVEEKYFTNIVWVIWEIILKEASLLNNDNALEQISALFKLYKFDFKPTKRAKRVYFILFAIKYFTETYNFKKEIIPNYYQLVQACGNINILFYERKRFEVNKLRKQTEETQFKGMKQKQMTEEQIKQEKAEIKRLKEVAELKIKKKIDRVELIDSMILSKKK